MIALGDQLHSGDRTIRELVRFNRAEVITDERIQERSTQVQTQIDAVREARAVSEKLDEHAAEHAEGRDDQGQAAVPPRVVGRDAGARRVLERHSQD